jgi:two-component system response regulator GlrR
MAAKTILVVDDEPMVVQLLEAMLSDAGYATIAARDAPHALAVVAVTRPELILADLRMPVIDGVAFCHAMLDSPATQTIPLVLIGTMADLRAVIDLPIAGFLPKPFRISTLLRLVATQVA